MVSRPIYGLSEVATYSATEGLSKAVTVTLAALALVSGAGCLGSSSSNNAPSEFAVTGAGPPLVDVTRAAVRYIRVPRGPHAVAAGDQAVWISTSQGVARLDPATGAVDHVIPIPNRSEWDDLTYGGGAIWYLEATGVITRVNPTTLRPVLHNAFGSDANLKGRNPQSWSWVAATSEGVCVGRLASGIKQAVLCFDPLLRRYWLERGGPYPLVAGPRSKVLAGGPSLTEINLRSRSARVVPLKGVASVTALTAGPSGLWAAVEPQGAHHTAEIWHIVGGQTVSRTVTDAGYIADIAVNRAGVWVLTPRRGRTALAAVEPSGSLKVAAILPADARSLTSSGEALWTANFRGSTVAKITGYTRPN
jgi:hypothetical protein